MVGKVKQEPKPYLIPSPLPQWPQGINCLGNMNPVVESLPNLDQVEALINHYGPMVYFHPDEVYLPSSVPWVYLTVKPTTCYLFTDIDMWIFCPLKGPDTFTVFKLLNFNIKGERVDDWVNFVLRHEIFLNGGNYFQGS
ncbi:hypothetical protein CTI12_AA535980 [Artemisia annua]|uniref:Uncharacterized protein n=1 Tax=Artemisia annua TaxID=35608 RepID=A0A2U1L3H1_ARTAN|nr:hypothetical protein CTI12_AA535980 [Artemisia annua]